jgi:hypothetical protein
VSIYISINEVSRMCIYIGQTIMIIDVVLSIIVEVCVEYMKSRSFDYFFVFFFGNYF